MDTKDSNKKNQSGFTLIELLIVIGLLGALTALILPSLSADRKAALMDVSEYNKAGTARTLYQYKDLVGEYPSDMHSGLSDMAAGIRIAGMPKCASFNVTTGGGIRPTSIAQLTATEASSLAAAGVDSLCYDTGLHSKTLADGDYVVMSCSAVDQQWLHKNYSPSVATTPSGVEVGKITFDGRTLDTWIRDMNSDKTAFTGTDGVVVAAYIAPTTDWSAGSGDNNDWTKGNVTLGIALEGQAPVPTEAAETTGEISFAYYVAHFLVDNDDTDKIQPAKLIGVTCPGGTALNP